jgi:hypothetical protein
MGSIQHRIWAAAQRTARMHVHSQEVAIRNAMVASTALTQRRRELIEVEEFLTKHRRQYDARAGVAVQRHRSA